MTAVIEDLPFQFFDDSEAIFFEDYDSLADKLLSLFENNQDKIASIAEIGRERVQADGRDYATILTKILSDSRVASNQEFR